MAETMVRLWVDYGCVDGCDEGATVTATGREIGDSVSLPWVFLSVSGSGQNVKTM